MRATVLLVCLVLALSGGSGARSADRAGVFDYYLLAITWMPHWCRAEGSARGDARCAPGEGRTWGLHGLWPQHEQGWPQFCRTAARDPTRAETAAMAAATGSAGLAWHQWRRHGRCSGLAAGDYFRLSIRAFEQVVLPELPAGGTVSPQDIRTSFSALNPGLEGDMLAVICRAGALAEVRLCLTRDLAFRRCGADVLSDCRLPAARIPAPP